jgi:hypothetical protein
MGTSDGWSLLLRQLLLMLALTQTESLYRINVPPPHFILHHPFLHSPDSTHWRYNRRKVSPVIEWNIHRKYILIYNVKITPTKCTLIYVSYEFLLPCFASEYNFLIQFFSITNNICLWKGLFRHDTLANYSKNFNKTRVIWRIFFGNCFQCKGRGEDSISWLQIGRIQT